MLKAAVLSHFHGSPVAVARALGITRSAVHQWPETVPLKSALRLQSITHGALIVDMTAYSLPDIAVRSRSQSRHAST